VNETAPAKVNLVLFLGPIRSDGRHELVTLFESISLADELELAVLDQGPDQVISPGVEGPNLVSAALEALRREGWEAPPVRVEIRKQIPVAAGLGGGSADAAAALRLAAAVAPLDGGLARRVARQLGADVPSQLEPGLWLGTGAGEELESLGPLATHAFVIVAQRFGLSTAAVYQEADRLGLPRSADDLARCRRDLADGPLSSKALVNDLEPATVSLAPSVSGVLKDVRAAGADQALVCGSGPTVMGVFWGEDALARAEKTAAHLAGEYAQAISATPIVAPQ
jgi:4-diphosphocytidyl-2-C-methyl-D-erythritol kinase